MTKIWKWWWLIIAMLVWAAFGLLKVYSQDWSALEAISTWMLVAGIFWAIFQVYETRKSTNAQLAVEFFQGLKDEKDILRRIYELGPENIKLISKNSNWCVDNLNKNKIDSVLDMFNMIGGLRKQGILDTSLAIGIIAGAPALRCWYKLNGYIKEERSKRSYVLEYYEDFTRECLAYFDSLHVKIGFYETGTNGTIIFKLDDLVEKLKIDPSLRPRSLKEIQQERDC